MWILFLLALFIIIVLYLLLRPKISHITPPVPPSLDCTPLSELKSCSGENAIDCGSCKGFYACTGIDKEYAYKDTNGNIVNIPQGKWCLPVAISSSPCNPYTGIPILTKVSDYEYSWGCMCKYPQWFRNNDGSINSDCTDQVVCGRDIPNSNNYLGCPTGSSSCNYGEPWNGKWDPKYGQCFCSTGLKEIEYTDEEHGIYIKNCVYDSCYPGKIIENKCVCPPNYIKCPENINYRFGELIKECDLNPQCVSDPCAPGHFDSNSGNCTCPQPFINTPDANSLVYYSCKNPCDPDHNPCADRGTCIVSPPGTAQCTNCNSPWSNRGDSTLTCRSSYTQKGKSCEYDMDCWAPNDNVGYCSWDYLSGRVCR